MTRLPLRRPGVRDIAKAARVSTATVSRVINGDMKVRAETRARVEAAIAATGFSRNPAARALATQRTRLIAAAIPTLEHSIFARFLNSVEETLADANYGLVIATTENDPSREHARAAELVGIGAEGIIVSGTHRDPSFHALVSSARIPVVCTSTYDPDASLPTIGYDNGVAAATAVRHLTDLGHRRIVLIHGPARSNDRTRLRIAGASDAIPDTTELRMMETTLDIHGGSAATEHLLERPTDQRPTAILCLSDVLAVGVLFALSRRGIAVPDAMSVMGIDGLEWTGLVHPPLTSVALPVAEMGRIAARALIARLDDNAVIEPRLLPVETIVRGSTAPPGDNA